MSLDFETLDAECLDCDKTISQLEYDLNDGLCDRCYYDIGDDDDDDGTEEEEFWS